MSLFERYKLRLERKDRRYRALHRGRLDLRAVKKRLDQVNSDDVLLFSVIRNERANLPFFLEYYRNLGINHFCFVDNQSQDETARYLLAQKDVSLWHAKGSYARAAYGIHWLNCLMSRYASGHWCLTVDADEFFVYPHCDTRPIHALTDWLDSRERDSFGTLLLDLYPKEDIKDAVVKEGESPVKLAPYFDSGNYTGLLNTKYQNIWIQGGPRQRVFFPSRPEQAPALNKIPLVKWQRGFVYIGSTHSLLPRRLNVTYANDGTQEASGVLLHAKFTQNFVSKVSEEEKRGMHYEDSREYQLYAKALKRGMPLYTRNSVAFQNWQQLQSLGLMSQAGWA